MDDIWSPYIYCVWLSNMAIALLAWNVFKKIFVKLMFAWYDLVWLGYMAYQPL